MPIVEVARSRGKGSRSLDAADRLVLIVGEWQTPQQVCAAYGYTPMFVHITQLSHDTKIQSYTEQLRSGRFCLLWMSLPSQTRANVWGETGTNKRLRQMKCWIEHAAKSSTPAVLYGFCGKAWKGDILESLLVNSVVTKSIHKWCHFKIRLWADGTMEGARAQPSARSVCVFSTFPFPSHLCRCPPRTEHYRDTLEDNYSGRGRTAAESAMIHELWATLGRLGYLESSRAPESNKQQNRQSNQSQKLDRAGLSESLPSNMIQESGFQSSNQSSNASVPNSSNTHPQIGSGSRSHEQEDVGQRRLEDRAGSDGGSQSHLIDPPAQDSIHAQPAYPTDQRERQKQAEQQRKANNTQPIKRKLKKHVEDHHDDCGEDLKGLGEQALWYECQDEL